MKFIRYIRILCLLATSLLLPACASEKVHTDDPEEEPTIKSNPGVEILFTDEEGETYPEIAIPNQVLIKFGKIDEDLQRQIIEECGGSILEHYPLLRSYLVETDNGKEMDFVAKARNKNGVERVNLNTVSMPEGIKMHIIDDFDTELDSNIYHGEYCYYSATTAYPEHPENIIKVIHNLGEDFSRGNVKKKLQETFSSTEPNHLILINLSLGQPIYQLFFNEKDRRISYVDSIHDTPVKIRWDETFENKYGEQERNYWKKRYLEELKELASDLETLSDKNPNFIFFKSLGNASCHEIDDFIFADLSTTLSPSQFETFKKHILCVSAKQDIYNPEGKIYANYANSPKQYCPYTTMSDISHLSRSGTSYSSPYLLGKAARLFDIYGYRPMNSTDDTGVNVEEMVEHIHNSTRRYAEEVEQPGLYTDNYLNLKKETYYYGKNYTFTGILRRDTEDLCGTGDPHTFYYIEIDPIDIKVDGYSDFEEPLSNITELQLFDKIPDARLGQKITVTGTIEYHIAGCRIHTDAYLENITFTSGLSEDSTARQESGGSQETVSSNKTYYYVELSNLQGILRSKTISRVDEFTGEIKNDTYYYLQLDKPIDIEDRRDPLILPVYAPEYNVTTVTLSGHFNPRDYIGQHVFASGQLKRSIRSSPGPSISLVVNYMDFN